ncbi:hypothetical protein [Burkholderia pseudomallei]|uniref:hypothetical protein n=2 Tax=Burkholderia pseudomallei TaxID=28450 RepID=UPI000682F8A7|nr:hypothetical protein [Burkholderia pseudomallei]KYZ79019.1 hypothetical protein PTBPS01_03875 [Burkholderia pseudomallei]BEH18887.1 hypothetical protein GTC019_20650 [Burkholderia pseudomallei]BEH34162.1 hypothetical protein GTC054_53780 [Burkholderia pseudomallei]BEH66998.1 hypothetical protein BpKM391_20730 [Burkholderia pseudomallei]
MFIKMISGSNLYLMKTCLDIRLDNARALAKGGPAEFARVLGMTSQQANQLIGPNPKRGIGHEKAREIEAAFGKESGWLDHDHSSVDLDLSISGQNSALSDEAKRLISCVVRLDSVGELARKTFLIHAGLLQLSAAFIEFQTGSAQSQMLAEIDELLGPRVDSQTGPSNERNSTKQ